jgi:hypothetical protein|tara:strand:+ start:6494 stop:7441 length:948 start_codon:yes stop_codon:yes gene_type:complete
MNIAVITPPREFNLGNGIFADGGIHLVNKFFKKHNIYIIEYFQSCQSHRSEKTKPFTSGTLKWIDQKADLIILLGGCCLSEVMFDGFFKPMFDIKKPILGLGLGCTTYDDKEKSIAEEVFKNCEAIITRDKYLYDFISDSKKSLNGLDGGYFCSDFYKCTEEDKKYAVSNIDSQGKLCLDKPKEFSCGNAMEEAQKLSFLSEDVYVVSNNSNLLLLPDHPKVLQITTSQQLWSLYKNASIVSTTRAHTAICCLTEGTSLNYYGHMDKRALGMIEQCDIDLSNNTVDLKESKIKIEKTKNKYLKELEIFFNENNIT